jgi:FMN reductase
VSTLPLAVTALADRATAPLPPAGQHDQRPLQLVAVSAGLSDPSSTRLLTERILTAATAALRTEDREVSATIIDLAPLAEETTRALLTGITGPRLQSAIETLARADALVAATPVYKAGVSGLFKTFLDLLDDDLLLTKPTILAATGGSARHGLVADDQMRGLFAFFRAITTPTSLYAAPEDWADPSLARRISRAAAELAFLVLGRPATRIAEDGWDGYQHQFAGRAAGAARTVGDVDFTTDLMRLATGGGLQSAQS